jgi:hypothetical protein
MEAWKWIERGTQRFKNTTKTKDIHIKEEFYKN